MFRMKRMVNKEIDRTIRMATELVNRLTDTTFKSSLFSMMIVTTIWVSIFLYITFYYAYMPLLVFTRPIHMQFKNCNSQRDMCDYPSAHIKLMNHNQLLMIGQKYKMIINMELPESTVNEEIGMFMLCIRLSDKYGYLVGSSCRSSRLKYMSLLYRYIYTLFMTPFYLTGLSSEKQLIQLEMFTDFEDDQLHPITDIHFEILNHDIQIYSAKINVMANLSGLRYLMFHWPILSAFIGIGTNLLFVLFIFFLSWRHIYGSEVFQIKSTNLLEHIDSEDESEISDDSYERSLFYRTSSKRMVPEQ